jgi:hypothetical protein
MISQPGDAAGNSDERPENAAFLPHKTGSEASSRAGVRMKGFLY